MFMVDNAQGRASSITGHDQGGRSVVRRDSDARLLGISTRYAISTFIPLQKQF